jgi:thiosulfate dehydrogenase
MNARLASAVVVAALAIAGSTILIAADQLTPKPDAGKAGVPVAKEASGEPAPATPFTPPPESAIPDNDFGKIVREGEAIFRDPAAHAGQYVGNQLHCTNCHLDAGRLANASPMWAAYVTYPAYRSKNGHVNTFEERLQGCFRFSMNGKAPPLGDPVLVALESYAYFLAKGAPTGAELPGRGYPKLAKPGQASDYHRGQAVYQQKCKICHGANGEGQSSAGAPVFPALWGAQSFNWGAGMGSVANAAAFIKANMPLGQGGSLTDQDAWDVAMFMDGHERPQDPRFVGTVAETRAKFHDSESSLYGQTVNGVLLGEHSPPAGPRPK